MLALLGARGLRDTLLALALLVLAPLALHQGLVQLHQLRLAPRRKFGLAQFAVLLLELLYALQRQRRVLFDRLDLIDLRAPANHP